MAGGVIRSGSSMKKVIAQSSPESGLFGMLYAAEEAVYLRGFLSELDFWQFTSFPPFVDSTAALGLRGNPIWPKRVKPVAIRLDLLRD